jgi:hypothetical protein
MCYLFSHIKGGTYAEGAEEERTEEERGNRDWKRPHNVGLYMFSPNTTRVIKSRRIKWVGHVAHIGDRRGTYKVLVRKHEG